ncbi:MAG: hypothetical protein AAFR61_28535, partial [Bacteroidota bacterium]
RDDSTKGYWGDSTTHKYVTPERLRALAKRLIRGLHDYIMIAETSDNIDIGVLDPDSSPPCSRRNFRGDKMIEEEMIPPKGIGETQPPTNMSPRKGFER